MAWIEIHDNLPDHPKTIVSAAALKMDKDALTGKLLRFWTWALENRASGFIPRVDMETVAEKMRWNKKPDVLFEALCMVPDGFVHGFLYEVDGGFMIHDWDVYTNRYRAQDLVRKKDRERKAKEPEFPAEFQRNSSGNPVEKTRNATGKQLENERNSAGVPAEETRNSRSYRNLYQEEEERAPARVREGADEDENGNPLADPAWKRVSDCYLAQIGLLSGGKAEETLQTYTDDLGADVVCLAITETNLKQPGMPMPFLLKMLGHWYAEGVRTEEQAKALMRDRERGKRGGAGASPPERAREPTQPEQPRIPKIIAYDDGTCEEVWTT